MRILFFSALTIILSACAPPTPNNTIFAGITSQTSDSSVSIATPVVLPDDHRSHPDYELEWWYLTFVLNDNEGKPYALQFTLFRFLVDSSLPSAWSNNQIWMGHASLHTSLHHVFEERFAAGGVGNAGVISRPFSAKLDNWVWQSQSDTPFPSTLSFTINDEASVALRLTTIGPMVKHGNNGISVKSANGTYRSYYYSQPFIEANGEIEWQGQRLHLSGNGWFDHEWTSALADEKVLGWDWFSLHLQNGDKLMAFRMHVKGAPPFTTGTYIEADGSSTQLSRQMVSVTPEGADKVGDRRIPLHWRICIPSKAVNVQVSPFKQDQWNSGRFPYYEGRVEIKGSHSGAGFMELTGY